MVAPREPATLWSVTLPGSPSPDDLVLIGPGGRAYVRVDTNEVDTAWLPTRLVAVDAGGAVAWQRDVDGVLNGVPLLAADGHVVALVSKPPQRTLVWFTPGGAVARTAPIAHPVRGEPAVASDGSLRLIVDDFKSPVRVVALSPTGDETWLSDELVSSPRQLATGWAGDVLVAGYVGTLDDYGASIVVASIGGDGEVRWRTEVDPHGHLIDGPVVGRDGAAYVVLWTDKSTRSTLVVVEPGGSVRRRVDLHEEPWGGGVTRLSVGADGAAYVKAGEALLAIDAEGHERWRRYAHPNVGIACTIDGSGAVLVSGGALDALDPLGGQVLWHMPGPAMSGNTLYAVGGATIGDGRLMFTDYGKKLYALGLK